MSEVVLPALGESVTEGTVTRWLKKVGDQVAIDEPLVEVSTDKGHVPRMEPRNHARPTTHRQWYRVSSLFIK